MEKDKVTCPQCGAQATPGRFCEYCGTKIPVVTKKESSNEKEFNSWYDVIPVGYEACLGKCVKGDYKKSQFLVVTPKVGGNEYGIINRQGKFVVDCNKRGIILFLDNYDYIVLYNYKYDNVKGYLSNLIDNVKYLESVEFKNIKKWIRNDLLCILVESRYEYLYDRLLKKYIQLPVYFLKKTEDFNLPSVRLVSYFDDKDYKDGDICGTIMYNCIELRDDGCIGLKSYMYFKHYYLKNKRDKVGGLEFGLIIIEVYDGLIKYDNGVVVKVSENFKSDAEIDQEARIKVEEDKINKKREKKKEIKENIIVYIIEILFLLAIVGLLSWPVFVTFFG